jgi:hypothetical protein
MASRCLASKDSCPPFVFAGEFIMSKRLMFGTHPLARHHGDRSEKRI